MHRVGLRLRKHHVIPLSSGLVAAATYVTLSSAERRAAGAETPGGDEFAHGSQDSKTGRNATGSITPLAEPAGLSPPAFSPASVASWFSTFLPSKVKEEVDLWKSHTGRIQSPDDVAAKRNSKRSMAANLRRYRTLRRMGLNATKVPLESKYIWHKDKVLGVGAYGSVYLATSKATGESVALKEIAKKHTSSLQFQREMRTMLYIKSKGGHPHVCQMREHFEQRNNYHVILDYISGGELFDHLTMRGPYSEMEASRLVREVASALNFLHGIGVVHGDMKPENILLSTSRRGDASVKLADFGCSQLLAHADESGDDGEGGRIREEIRPTYGAPTPAYSPKECIEKKSPIQSSTDMWALGIILFIMLTGAHPYDVKGGATDKEVVGRIVDSDYEIPIDDEAVAGHLSESAKDLIRGLMHKDPEQRLTALQMLQHPWIRGETASRTVIAGSDSRLSKYRRYKTELQAKFFEAAVLWDDQEDEDMRRQSSLLERSFKKLDALQQGFLTSKELFGTSDQSGPQISLSDFANLMSDNIVHKHFPAGHVVYEEGTKGNHMYFIDSGTIQVDTESGSQGFRNQGDFFGEGALLHQDQARSATVTCTTPVHALEINREYFEKYVARNDSGVLLTIKETDKMRRRNRTRTVLGLQNTQTVQVGQEGNFFEEGDELGDSLFILEEGKVDSLVEGHHVLSILPGNVFGEQKPMTGRPRTSTAKCISPGGCIAQELLGHDLRKLVRTSPHIRTSLRDLQLRREFKMAVVRRLNKQFPYQNPQEAFQAADRKDIGVLDKQSVAELLREVNKDYTDKEIQEMLQSLHLSSSGTVTFEEFKKVVIGDKRTQASM